MAINRTIIVTIPSEAYIEKNSFVFVKDKNVYDPEKRYNRVKHTIIGRSIGNGQMHPNHNFRIRYPALFEAAAGEQLPKQTKKFGFYSTVLSLAERTGLYDALIGSFGVENANRIMDLAMYCIILIISRQWIRSGTLFRSTVFPLRTTGSHLGSTYNLPLFNDAQYSRMFFSPVSTQ